MGEVELWRDALLVCEQHGEPVAAVVGEGLLVALAELGAPGDQTRPLGPGGEIDTAGDLDDLATDQWRRGDRIWLKESSASSARA